LTFTLALVRLQIIAEKENRAYKYLATSRRSRRTHRQREGIAGCKSLSVEEALKVAWEPEKHPFWKSFTDMSDVSDVPVIAPMRINLCD
jgi:hypothetical protein